MQIEEEKAVGICGPDWIQCCVVPPIHGDSVRPIDAEPAVQPERQAAAPLDTRRALHAGARLTASCSAKGIVI
jgi:hypothetical protein